jgi:glycosyltransferase involved in cell wall biosynthesis
MNNPLVTIIILTFARIKNLEEAIFSALNQNYDNYNIFVLNQCEQQKLYINHNKVKIINVEKTFDTMSKAWNELIKNANGEMISMMADDDLIMPWHIKEHVENILQNNLEASILEKCIFWERRINKTSIAFNAANIMWKKLSSIKFDENLKIGEDQLFLSLLKQHKYKILNNNPSFVYCWDNGTYHVSGNPNDIGGFYRDVLYRLDNKIEPSGNIEIVPKLKEDARILLKV